MSSPNGIGLAIRVSNTGTEQAYENLRKLHDELIRGDVSAKQYRTGIRENSALLNANTKLWSESQAAIYAANPRLLEFTRTMSGFGQVTAAATSGMTAINTALLLMAGGSDAINQTKIKIAEFQNQLDNLTAAGQGTTTQAQNLRNAIAQLKTVLGNETNQLWISQTAAVISFGGALGQMTVGAVAAGTTLKTLFTFLGGGGGAQLLENFSIAAMSIGPALITAGLGIGVFLGVLYGGRALMDRLIPGFAKWDNEVEKAIKDNWHVDDLTAYLLAPFVGALVGMERFGEDAHTILLGLLTDFVNFGNPLGLAMNAAAALKGQNVLQNPVWTPPTWMKTREKTKEQILQELTGGSSSLLPTASGEMMNTTKQQLSAQQINNLLVTGILTNSASQASSLIQINSNVQQQTNAITSQILSQKDAVIDWLNAAKGIINDLENRLSREQAAVQAEQDKLNKENAATNNFADFGEIPASTVALIHDINTGQQNITSLQSQLKQAQQNANIYAATKASSGLLDVRDVGVQSVLSSLGLNVNEGFGSVVASALGLSGGVGGAGISSADIQQFLATGDYGVFTKAALRDNAIQASQATKSGQANSLYDTLIREGFSPSVAGANVASAIYGERTTSNPSLGTGAFLGLPGQYGNPPITVNVYNAGSVIAQNEFEDSVQHGLKHALKRAGYS